MFNSRLSNFFGLNISTSFQLFTPWISHESDLELISKEKTGNDCIAASLMFTGKFTALMV